VRSIWKVTLVLLLTVLLGRADAATEWVKLYRGDSVDPEWIQIITDEGKGQIVAINDNAFTVNIGMHEGARKGGLYLVYSERVPQHGKEPLAILRVLQTAAKFSICDMTPYVNGGLIHVGDKVVPAAVSATNAVVAPYPVMAPGEVTITEGYISQNGPGDKPIPAIYSTPPPPVAVVQYPTTVYTPQGQIIVPAAAPQPTQYAYQSAPPAYPPQQPAQYNYQAAAMPPQIHQQPVQYNYPPAYTPAGAPPESPYPGAVTYPPYPNYQYSGQVQLDFDANRIADSRLIRTFPLSQPDMNSLEIQFRGAYDLYAARRYYEAFEAFMKQTSFPGNYLSPYWAGMSALGIGDRQTAVTMFNNALSLNPYYEPARNGLQIANGAVPPAPPQQKPATKPKRRK
jgi:hypothetical protein